MNPTVSVITPAYNVAPYIRRAVRSALSQTLSDIEVIVVDDGSVDGTVDAVRSLADPRVCVLVNRENRGPSFSRNRAIEAARGEWIAVLDGDDWWEERRLEVLVREGERTGADVVCDDLFLIMDQDERPWSTQFKENGVVIGQSRTVSAAEVVEKDFGPVKPLFRKSFLDRADVRYREELRYGEDFAFLLDCLFRGARLVVVPEALYYYVSRPGSLVSEKVRLFERTLALTRQLTKELDLRERPDLERAFRRRERRIRTLLRYYGVVEPLRSGRPGAALRYVVSHPSSLIVLSTTVPGILYRRLLRRWIRRPG
ncbi:MAG: glycosyltransferase family 2 protein [Kyrpidia sp.]|nr:glycosyltransferase family 2 protein [Kyrpidia sp.]